MAWSLYEVADNSQWQNELREEVLSARAQKGGELGMSDFDKLPKLNAHIKVSVPSLVPASRD